MSFADAVPFAAGALAQIASAFAQALTLKRFEKEMTSQVSSEVSEKLPFGYRPENIGQRLSLDDDIAPTVASAVAIASSAVSLDDKHRPVLFVGLILAALLLAYAVRNLIQVRSVDYSGRTWGLAGDIFTPATRTILIVCSVGIILSLVL